MFVSNTTFMLSASMADLCLAAVRETIVPAAFTAEAGAHGVRMLELRGVGGGVQLPADVRSIALQAEFDTRAKLDAWISGHLEPALASFAARFGSEEIALTTVLEEIAL